MSDSKLGVQFCVVLNCSVSSVNKPSYVSLHPFPTSYDMRQRWLSVLKTRCTTIDWNRSRICSNHFETKYMDAQRQLRSHAVPTRFPKQPPIVKKFQPSEQPGEVKAKIDKLLHSLSQSDLQEDIRNNMLQIKMPENISVNDALKCPGSASIECKYWLLLKKQEHLINRLNYENLQNQKHIEILKQNMEESRNEKKEMEQSLHHYKYLAKCLQEKHTTLEEQIEILTAVETR